MSSALRKSSRRGIVFGMVVGLGLVIVSPLWHHGHRHPAPAAELDKVGVAVEGHICDTGSHLAGRLGACPICLSQRLLTESRTEAASPFPGPFRGLRIAAVQSLHMSLPVGYDGQPRAPPGA